MKKTKTGLLALWLALILTVFSVPQAVYADTDDSPADPSYGIIVSSAGNGGCRVQVDGRDVSSAAPQQRVTIKPEPADTYELDTVTVTKKDDSGIAVTVTGNSFIMPDYPVSVYVTFRRPSCHITLPSGTGYHAASQQPATIEYGSRYTFTIALEDAYEASGNFSVTANDTVLTPTQKEDNTYTYTLYYVDGNQTIRVTGVKKKDTDGAKDGNPPKITITLNKDNIWKDFMGRIPSNIFFSEKKSLTISVSDPGSGVREGSVKYYLASQDLFGRDNAYTAREIEQRIPFWTGYKGAIVLPDDRTYILYAKAEDRSGNVSYASTAGIIIDTTAPSADRIQNGKTYYGNSTFTIRDEHLKTVMLDKKAVKTAGSTCTFTIAADNRLHTVYAADRAGNSISYTLYVKDLWLRDGISVSGRYSLQSGNPYKLCRGKWKIKGDSTVYRGSCTIYADKSSKLDFQKQ